MPTFTIYSRRGCHLCEQLVDELLPMLRDRAELEIRDVDTRDDWRAAYDTRVPVVECNGRFVCEYRLDRAAISAILAAQS